MDYTTEELANAFESERLRYVRADKNGPRLQRVATELIYDPVIQALNAHTILQPRDQSESERDAYLQSVCDSLLGVAIFIRHESADAWGIIGVMCIGWGGISPSVMHHRNADIGITLVKAQHGKGYEKEAINWMLDWGFKHAGLHTIGIKTSSFNARAVQLYESMGFVLEGRRRQTIWQNRDWHDLVEFGMTEKEWEALRGFPPLKS